MDFKALFSQLVVLYSKLNKNQRIIIASAVIGIVAFLIFLVVYSSRVSSHENYAVLFEKLSNKDASKVIKILTKNNIPYKIYDNNIIKVPKNVVYKERISIAAVGIPKNNSVGFELFNTQKFGATSFDQNIEYLRALEGELSRTISALAPVEAATVSLAIPKATLFVQKQIAPTASVMVKLIPNMVLTPAQVRGIKNLVAASVPRLMIKNVTLVNSDGVMLGANSKAAQMSEASAVEQRYINEQERLREQKIISVLAPFVGGVSHVVAEVNIAYDFSKITSKSETYNPNNVVRSEQTVQIKSDGSKPSAIGGVPGAVSNIGPVKGVSSSTSIANKYSKNTDTTNYEISKTISSTTAQFARIKRITAAVVVDGKYNTKLLKNGQKATKYLPLNTTQLDAIKSLVVQAIGINIKRGDQVSVKNFEFKTLNNQKSIAKVKQVLSFFNKDIGPLLPMLKYLFVIVLIFILYKKVISPFAKEMLEISKEEEDIQNPVLDINEDNSNELVEKAQQMRKKVESQLGLGENLNEDELKYDVLLEKLKRITDENPDEIATLIQNLLSEEVSPQIVKPRMED